MNNEKELRKLTWKHFWRRKREEVWDFIKVAVPILLLIAFVFLFIVSFSGLILIAFGEVVPFYVSHICIPLFSIGVLILILYGLTKWIRSNWEGATYDARRELNQQRGRR